MPDRRLRRKWQRHGVDLTAQESSHEARRDQDQAQLAQVLGTILRPGFMAKRHGSQSARSLPAFRRLSVAGLVQSHMFATGFVRYAFIGFRCRQYISLAAVG